MKIIDRFCQTIRESAVFDPGVLSIPACILWPDQERQWEPVITIVQTLLPELFILGEYKPHEKTGPAVWLRCVIAGQIKDITLPKDKPPILYLPGYSRQNLRPVGNCPDPLKPLAELQYCGLIWSQLNNKDWTVLAFLQSGI